MNTGHDGARDTRHDTGGDGGPDTARDTRGDGGPDTGGDTGGGTGGDVGGEVTATVLRLPGPRHPDAPADTAGDEAPAPAVTGPAPQLDEADEAAPGAARTVAGEVLDPGPLARWSAPAQIVPGWLSSRDAFTGLVRETCDRAWRTAAFHALRSPVYWARLSVRAPRTIARMLSALYEWTTDAPGRAVRHGVAYAATLGGADAEAFRRVTEQHHQRRRRRMTVVAAGTTGLAAGLAVAAPGVPGWGWAGIGALALPVLGMFSRDPHRPVVDSTAYATGTPVLDVSLIVDALDALGIAPLSRGLKQHGLTLAGPLHRDGPGWRADIDLPPGVPAADVAERRDKLAAGLRRKLSTVWPEPDADVHEARLVLWVGDKALSEGKPKPWPLAAKGSVDLFKPFPIGLDPRGRPVALTLMFASMLVGAVPRMGKTFSARLILLAAALDPTAELHIYDLKGGADWKPLEAVAHRFRAGDDDDDLAYLARDTAELRTEMSRRYAVLRSLPETLCPEGKITPELCQRRDLGLHPIVLSIDECQFGFEHPEHGGAIETAITDLVKRGPAVGIIVLLATQRPDAKSVPTGISANAVLRFCLKVMGHTANDLILGTGSYKSGVRASMFARSDRGVGYLVGEGDDPVIVATSYIDQAQAKTIAQRARAARIAAGRLTGHAAGVDVEPERRDGPTLLDDLAAVMPPGETKAWTETLLTRLGEHRPDPYAAWTPADLGNALAAHGLNTVQIGRRQDGRVVNKRGITRDAVTQALTDRDGTKATNPGA